MKMMVVWLLIAGHTCSKLRHACWAHRLKTYLHRIGRTGRFAKRGIAVNFIDGQRSMVNMKKIEEHFGKKILLLETNDVDALEKLV